MSATKENPTACPRCGLRIADAKTVRCPRCAGVIKEPRRAIEPVVPAGPPPSRTGRLVAASVVGALLGCVVVAAWAHTANKRRGPPKKPPGAEAAADPGAGATPPVAATTPPAPGAPGTAPPGPAPAPPGPATPPTPPVDAPVVIATQVQLDSGQVYVLAEASPPVPRDPTGAAPPPAAGAKHTVLFEWNRPSPNSWGFNTPVVKPVINPTDGALLFMDGETQANVRSFRPYTRSMGEVFDKRAVMVEPQPVPQVGSGCLDDPQELARVSAFLVVPDTGAIAYGCANAPGKWILQGKRLKFDGTPVSVSQAGFFLTVSSSAKLQLERGDGASPYICEDPAGGVKGADFVAVRAAADGFLVAYLVPTGAGETVEIALYKVDFRGNLNAMPAKFPTLTRAAGGHLGQLTSNGDLYLLPKGKGGRVVHYRAGAPTGEDGLVDGGDGSEGPHITDASRLVTGP